MHETRNLESQSNKSRGIASFTSKIETKKSNQMKESSLAKMKSARIARPLSVHIGSSLFGFMDEHDRIRKKVSSKLNVARCVMKTA